MQGKQGDNQRARTSFSNNDWNRSRSERLLLLVIGRSTISDLGLGALSLSRGKGDIGEGDAAMEDRLVGRGMRLGSSMPRYPYRSASACASARVPDEDNESSGFALNDEQTKKKKNSPQPGQRQKCVRE